MSMPNNIACLEKFNTGGYNIIDIGVINKWCRSCWHQLYFQPFSEIAATVIVRTKLISRHYDDPQADHVGIDKTQELIARKYYWPTLHHDVEAYVAGCGVCLVLKVVRHKPYGDLQFLHIPTHQWKDLSIDFVTGLPVSTN